MSKVYWRCYPPFVDAYYTSDGDEENQKNKRLAFKHFNSAIRSLPSRWGYEALGRAVIKEINLKFPGYEDGTFIFACGEFIFKEVKEKYVLIGKDPYGEDFELIRMDYPRSWDVT